MNIVLAAVAAVVVGAAPTVAAAQVAPAAAPPRRAGAASLPTIETWRLANGLTVAFAALPGVPAVSVQLWYSVGAADDPAGKRGLARLFENLMFAGSARLRPGDHRAYLERTGGTASASVSEDVSAFADTVPAERLELALDLEAERMRGLELSPDAVAQAVQIAQAQVAQQAQSPLWRAYRRLLATSFVQHPYGHSVAGVPGELESITFAEVRAFYDTYYQPSNALLVVVGGVERDELERAVAARFAGFPRAADPSRRAAELPEPPQSARRREEIAGSEGLVLFGFHIPAATSPEVYALQLLGQILTGGKSARLGVQLIDKGRATDLGGQVLVRRDPGLFLMYAGAARGESVDALEGSITAELAALARSGPTAAELSRARKQIAASVYGAAQSTTGLGNQIGMAWALTGKPDGLADDLAALATVGAAAVKRAAAGHLGPDQATIMVGIASKGGK